MVLIVEFFGLTAYFSPALVRYNSLLRYNVSILSTISCLGKNRVSNFLKHLPQRKCIQYCNFGLAVHEKLNYYVKNLRRRHAVTSKFEV
jgi:hypothetical protein